MAQRAARASGGVVPSAFQFNFPAWELSELLDQLGDVAAQAAFSPAQSHSSWTSQPA